MRFKAGVVAHKIGPKVDRAMDIVDEIYWQMFGFDLTVTSIREGKHSLKSLHYYRPHDKRRWPANPEGSQGAFDSRTWTKPWVPVQMLPATKESLAKEIRRRLDEEFAGEFDVVVESTHIHTEHDPKIGS